jgi:aryl-alcohol dehydrogenase-like predicted oxidoreductase
MYYCLSMSAGSTCREYSFLAKLGDVSLEQTRVVWTTLDQLRQEGLIRAYGWSTADPERASVFATQSHGTTLQHPANVLQDAAEIFTFCARHNLASINNSPLAVGFLSGKVDSSSQLPTDDVRGSGHTWVAYFTNGKPRQEFLDNLAAVCEILSPVMDGRLHKEHWHGCGHAVSRRSRFPALKACGKSRKMLAPCDLAH